MIPACRLLLLATTAGSTIASGADGPGGSPPLDEERFVAAALSSGPAARLLESEAALERAESAGAGQWPNPSLGWEREAGAAGGVPQTQDKITASVPLVISGRLGLEGEAADLRREAASARLARERAVLRRDAIRVFGAVRAAEERVGALEQSRTALAELARTILARERAGDAAGYDRIRIELEAATVDELWSAARRDLRRARSAAGALLGVDANALPPLSGELARPRSLPEISAIASRLEAQRADLRALALDARAAERAEAAASRSWVPDPTVGGGAFLLGGPGPGTGYTVTLSVPLPLFQRGQGDAARAAARRHLAQDRRAVALRQALGSLEALHSEATGGREQLERHRLQVLARAAALRQVAIAAYRGGGADLLALVDAERALREAKQREIELAAQVTEAEADLLLLAGQLDGPAPEEPHR